MPTKYHLLSKIFLRSFILMILISINGYGDVETIDVEQSKSLVFSIYPENNINSMGSVYKIIDDNNKLYRSTATIMKSGLDHNPYPSTMNYRGYAKFDLSNFPSNVCIDSVIFEAITIQTIIDHPNYYAEIVRLQVDPAITYMDTILTHLFDSISTGFVYDTSLQLAQVIGTHTVSLGAQGVVDLENALQKGWFAVGLDSFYHMMIAGVVLRVYGNNLSVGPPKPVASNTTPCSNESYTVSWNNIEGATSYRLYQNSSLIYTGTSTSYVASQSSGTGISFTVSYNSICGWSVQSDPELVTILTNTAVPFPPVSSNDTPCRGENFIISWDPVPGATIYRLYQNDNLRYQGSGTFMGFTYSSFIGTFNYRIEYGNSCGWGPTSGITTVNVIDPPETPVNLISSLSFPCPNQSFEMTWNSTPMTATYRLFENDVQIYEGSDTSFVLSRTSGTYSYNAIAGNSCGWSGNSTTHTLSISETPETPVNLISSLSFPCPNQSFEMTWNSTPMTATYRLFENDVQIYEGSDTSFVLSRTSGTYSYNAIAGNSCGWSGNSTTHTLSISETPETPLAPTASTTSPCENTMYTINWTPVAGASEYRLYENDDLIYEGGNTSFQITNPTGSYSYNIIARDDCNQWTDPSNSLPIEVSGTPSAPATFFSPWPTPCHKESVLLIWSSVPNTIKYFVYRDNLELISTTDTTIWILIESENNVGFTIFAENDCGMSAASMEIKIYVGAQPEPPENLYCPVESVEIDEKYSLSWDKTEFPVAYVLYENGVQIYSGLGSNISLSQEIPGDYNYTISVCSECNCSDTVATLLIIVIDPVNCCLLPGDANHNGEVNIADLTYFIDYMFHNTPPPICYEEFDTNGNCEDGISNLTYFVDFMFQNGPPPVACHSCP